MKKFNIKGFCSPEDDYMVDISGKIAKIKSHADGKQYFSVGGAPKYGKTTILAAAERALREEYTVISLNFFQPNTDYYTSAEKFCREFIWQSAEALRFAGTEKNQIKKWENYHITNFVSLSGHITELCKKQKKDWTPEGVQKANRLFCRDENSLFAE
jgi:hypothetical protein